MQSPKASQDGNPIKISLRMDKNDKEDQVIPHTLFGNLERPHTV